MIKVTLYTKLNCRLCDEMKKIILKIKDEFDFLNEELYIENDLLIFNKYKEKIPVLMIEGKMFAKYRVNEELLRKRVRQEQEKSAAPFRK